MKKTLSEYYANGVKKGKWNGFKSHKKNLEYHREQHKESK